MEPLGGEIPVDHAEAFDARFAAVRQRLHRICVGLVGADLADDVVQDTYLAGRSRFRQLRDIGAFEAWIIRVAVNRCMDEHRQRGRRVTLTAGQEPAVSHGSDLALTELVEHLPPRERAIVVLHYGYGYRLAELARLLRLSDTNVRTIIARARKRLLHEWQEADR